MHTAFPLSDFVTVARWLQVHIGNLEHDLVLTFIPKSPATSAPVPIPIVPIDT